LTPRTFSTNKLFNASALVCLLVINDNWSADVALFVGLQLGDCALPLLLLQLLSLSGSQ
jgi:hypothetical protein